MAGASLLRRAAGLAIDQTSDVVIDKTLRNTAGEHAFRLEAEAVIPVLACEAYIRLCFICLEANKLTKLVAFINEVRTQ